MNDYLKKILSLFETICSELIKAKKQCIDAIHQIESPAFELPNSERKETSLNKISFFHRLYLFSLKHLQLILKDFNTAINDKKNEAKTQHIKQVDKIEQLKEFRTIEIQPFSKCCFSTDLVPIVFPPNLREHEISILKDYDFITATPESNKFHDCIDIDTYSLKFKNVHYYFYRNLLVIDCPSGIYMIDYDKLNITKGMREISRSIDNFSWSGWYLEITSKSGRFKVNFACKEEIVLEWLNICFSLSVKNKLYTHEDVIREITTELERRNAEIEAKEADRRNRPDYYAALDWVAEKQEILSSSRRAISSQTDQIKRIQAQTKLYNTLSKLIEQTGKKQLKATGEARAVYDAFAAKLEELSR